MPFDFTAERLTDVLSRSWWILLLRGLAAILFGVLTIVQPEISLSVLALMFGAFALADGLLGTWAAFQGHMGEENLWLLLLGGLLGTGVGLLTLFAPSLTAVTLLFYIAVWAVSTGVLQVATAVRLRREIEGEGLLILSGIASIGFGVFLMARPGPGALAVLWLIGAYAVVLGSALVWLAFKVRALRNRTLDYMA